MPDKSELIPYYNLIRNAQNNLGPEDLPVIGDVWRGTNAIVDFYEFGCFPDWEVWVESALESIGELGVALLGFAAGDILRRYFRPSSVRGLGGLNRLKPPNSQGFKPAKTSRLAGKIRIPETGNMIGKKLPGARFIQGKQTGKAFQRFWKIDGIAQRGLWYWLIADVSADFTVNWTSAIMNSSACSPGSADCYNYRHAQGPFIFQDWFPWAVINPTVEDPVGCFNGTGFTAIGSAGSCAISAKWVPYIGEAAGASLRIYDVTAGETAAEVTYEPDDPEYTNEGVAFTRTKHLHQYEFQYKLNGGVSLAQEDAWSAIATS